MRLTLQGGRVVDPANGVDRVTDLHVADGRVLALGAAPLGFAADRTLVVGGRVVCPGLVDLRARLREPGLETKTTIGAETAAAVAGGITTLCCPPDTDPVVDTRAVVELIHQRAARAGKARVEVVGALTQRLEGQHLAEMGALDKAGCVGVGNASRPVRSTEVMRRAMQYAATFGLTVFLHPMDPWLSEGRDAHDGVVATRLGLPGVPECAETVTLARDLLLVEATGVRAHVCGLSTARAVDMVAEAQGRGLPVTADVAIHHLHLTENDLLGFDARCHVCPPLRTVRDRAGLRAGLTRGVVAAAVSDHQPHELDAKLNPFSLTEVGIAGLETLLPLTLRLVDEGLLDLGRAIAALTSAPARILGIDRGDLSPGRVADICVLDPEAQWTLTEESLVTRGRNTPFLGWDFKGQVTHALLGGEVVFERGASGP
jgi:dihydroorotase